MTKCAVLFATMTLVFVGTGFGQKPSTMTVKVYFHNEKPLQYPPLVILILCTADHQQMPADDLAVMRFIHKIK